MNVTLETWIPGGAVLTKELRCASRRGRYYLLRCGYLIVLIIALCFAWLTSVRFRLQPSVYSVGVMSEVARTLSIGIGWYQFLLSQCLMVLLMSGAIAEELSRKTLGVLLLTPLTSLQIALGKLLSRGVHLLLLLGLSLPVLAIIRVMGGVPWGYIGATWCVILCAALATASLALFMSTWTPRLSQATGRTLMVLILLQLLNPILQLLSHWLELSWTWISPLSLYINPFHVMGHFTENLSASGTSVATFWWPGHCLVMCGFALVLLGGTVLRIRRIGRLAIEGHTESTPAGKQKKRGTKTICPVWEPVLVWRTVRHLYNSLFRWSKRLELLIGSAILIAAYLIAGLGYEAWTDPMFHGTFLCIFTFAGFLRIAGYASRSVVEEREKRTWPLLLTTSLSPRAIVHQKALACFVCSAPAWILLTIHLFVFIALRTIHPITPFLLLPYLLSYAAFIAYLGIWISLRCHRTSTATAITVAVYLFSSIPICCPFIGFFTSPLFSTGFLMASMSGLENATHSWREAMGAVRHHPLEFLETHWTMVIKTAAQGFLAWVFLTLAPHRVRRQIFSPGRD